VNDEDPLILFLYNVEHDAPYGNPQDLIALQDTASAAAQLIEALRSREYRINPIEVRDSLDDLRNALRPFSPEKEFAFNYCDGFRGNNMAATKVVRLVEALGFKHTGSTANVITACIDKSRTKQRLIAAGIPTPRFQVYKKPIGAYRYNFPAIVKPMTDDGSMGISFNSVVRDDRELLRQVAYVIETYKQPALVEEFITGRELAVSMWGNKPIRVLPIAEMDYSCIDNPLQRILTYESKWVATSPYYQNIVNRCPANLTPQDAHRVANVATRAFHAVGLRDLGRADIRFQNGIPYIVDINEIPALTADAGFYHSVAATGRSYADMAEHILELALRREGWKCPRPTLKSLSPQLQMAKASSH